MLGGFSESTVWLIVGAFVFSIGYRKSGLGKRLALLLVRRLGRNTLGLGYAVAFSDLVLAPATPSNTARSGGTIYPIVSNIPAIYGSEPGPTAGKIGTYVMWTAFAATAVTSSLFLTALAPNAAALSIAKKIAGVDVGWSQWFIGFAPLGVPLILLVPLLSYLICRPQVKESPEIVAWSANELMAMGPLSRNEWVMAGLVLLAMFLWITGSNPDISLPGVGSNFINATMVVFVVISLMLLTGVVEFADIIAEKAAWEVFFYMKRAARNLAGIKTFGEEQPNMENRVELMSAKDEFGMPLARLIHTYDQDAVALWNANLEEGLKVAEAAGAKEAWSARGAMPTSHLMGGTIMGTSAANSVVDSYGQSHEIPNLWIAGPSIFLSAGASNPTFTIFALSQRGAERMASQWGTLTN